MNDIDLQQIEAEQTANNMSKAKKLFGVCFHNSSYGDSPCICIECGKPFQSFDHLIEERRDLTAEYL